jgi:hypothetical protein
MLAPKIYSTEKRVNYIGRSGFPWWGSRSPKPHRKFIMSTKYWDLYVYYVKNCERENYINDIDPNHYQMEFNHFWPQCIFGEWPVGQWLTIRQHAIASALQTLVFKRNCMCPWHKQYLPPNLLALAWPYYCEAQSKSIKEKLVTIHSNKNENGKSLLAMRHNLELHAEKDGNGLSVFAVEKCGLKRKITVAISPDGSKQYFSSLHEASRFFGVVASSIFYRLGKGPSRRKGKLFGYQFDTA